jgi:glutathione reductase (NADPH)
MSTTNFDLIAIGTGPAASTVAKKVREHGKEVAIIETREFGGTCALRGCNPKKVYTNAAGLVDQARRVNGKLARFSDIQIDWAELLAFKETFTTPVKNRSEQSFQKKGIATFHGAASFVGPAELQVGDQRLKAKRILVATGAQPAPLQFAGAEHLINSDQFLELAELPRRVLFIGGGYISLEFGHVAARYGAEVTIIERGERILKGFDHDLVKQLAGWSAENGVQILTHTKIRSVQRGSNGQFTISHEQQGQQKSFLADLVVHGAGRVPNLDGLNLEAGNIAYDATGIQVDPFMRSLSNPVVFAAGDCAASGKPRLTPTANEEARIVAKNLFAASPEAKPDYGAIPQVAFTTPAIAAVGLSEAAARDAGFQLEIRHEDTSDWGSVRKQGQTCAGHKILIDAQTDQILGAHLLGPCAEETINLFALAMKFKLTARDIKSTLFAFPTFAADVRKML